MPKTDRWGNKIIFSEQEIQNRIQALGKSITDYYLDRPNELVVIGMLKGSLYLMTDLCRAIDLPLLYDFTAIGTRTKDPDSPIQLTRHVGVDLQHKDVLIVEEIIRTGLTTHLMVNHIEQLMPASINICTLLYNAEQTLIPLPIQFVGFNIGYERVLGYGIDYDDYGRDLKDIVELDASTVVPRKTITT